MCVCEHNTDVTHRGLVVLRGNPVPCVTASTNTAADAASTDAADPAQGQLQRRVILFDEQTYDEAVEGDHKRDDPEPKNPGQACASYELKVS